MKRIKVFSRNSSVDRILAKGGVSLGRPFNLAQPRFSIFKFPPPGKEMSKQLYFRSQEKT